MVSGVLKLHDEGLMSGSKYANLIGSGVKDREIVHTGLPHVGLNNQHCMPTCEHDAREDSILCTGERDMY